MTKRKAAEQHQKRGPKAGPDQAGMTWIAVEVRRDLGTVGRAHGSVSRAIEFLAQDLNKTDVPPPPIKTLRNRYYRAAARRKSDPAYLALLDYWLDYEKQRLIDDSLLHGGRKFKLLAVRPAALQKAPN